MLTRRAFIQAMSAIFGVAMAPALPIITTTLPTPIVKPPMEELDLTSGVIRSELRTVADVDPHSLEFYDKIPMVTTNVGTEGEITFFMENAAVLVKLHQKAVNQEWFRLRTYLGTLDSPMAAQLMTYDVLLTKPPLIVSQAGELVTVDIEFKAKNIRIGDV